MGKLQINRQPGGQRVPWRSHGTINMNYIDDMLIKYIRNMCMKVHAHQIHNKHAIGKNTCIKLHTLKNIYNTSTKYIWTMHMKIHM